MNGKINLEENMSALVTRITTRNYALTNGSFNLSLDPDGVYGQVISVAPGQANIQGYHIITNITLRVPPPQEIAPANHIVLGMKLARDSSEHILGDVTYAGETFCEGVWVSYFDFEEAEADPDIFILGYLDWDGTAMTNVTDNPEKYGRLDASDVICYLSDPKHPEYEFLTLQELTDNLKDWYVSKLGDDEYGEVLWRTSDKPVDPDNWGVSVVANSSSKSTITVKPSLVTDTAHTIVITSDFLKPMISIADTEMSVLNSDFLIQTVRDITLNSGRDIYEIADNSIVNKTKANNSLTTTLTSNNYTISSGRNDEYIDFSITGTDLKFLLGSALFDYSTDSKYLTISGNQRIMINDPTEFLADVRADQNLYFGNTPFTGSVMNKDNIKLTTTKGYTINLGNNGNGLNIKSSNASNEVSVKAENNNGAYGEIKTNGNNPTFELKSTGSGTSYINFYGDSSSNNNQFYKLAGSTAIRVQKDFIADGDITGNRVWRAVYN